MAWPCIWTNLYPMLYAKFAVLEKKIFNYVNIFKSLHTDKQADGRGEIRNLSFILRWAKKP